MPFNGLTGSFNVKPTDKSGRDFRGKGRLQYVGRHYLQFAGTGEYFLKAGPDSPETLLGTADFDNTIALKKEKVPLKTWALHVKDWHNDDPVWHGNKGKATLDLTLAPGEFNVSWFNPREGGALVSDKIIGGGQPVLLTAPSEEDDWLAIVKRRRP